MSLTRITSGVVSANAISAEKLANAALTSRNFANKSVELRHLADSANNTTSINTITTNINTVQSNVNTVQANVNSQRTNVNIVSSNVGNTVAFTANVEARRVANIAGAISTVLTADLTASRALISGSGGKIEVSPVTSTELGHLDGVSGAIQTQLDAVESRRAANLVTATFTDDVIITGNLIVNGDTTTANSINMVVQDRMLMLANSATGAPAADVGLLFNRGNQGNAAFFYDESAKTFKLSDTKDPSSNTSLSPVTASNLDVGIVTAATLNATAITQNGATLDNLIGSNVDGAISTVKSTDLTASRALVSSGSGKIEVSAVTATEIGHLDGVSGGIQSQLDSKIATTDSASNDFITFTRLNANINVVSANAALGLSQLTNVITSTGANTFHVATPPGSNPSAISNVQVFIDGLAQKPKTSSSDNDYIYTAGSGLVTITDASLPSGLTVQITALYPPG
tara:strand:- start:1068 stop:2441 length:1374 start_codon:yes stop_codon:yes gene_type:complete